jgi:hypothetical protein
MIPPDIDRLAASLEPALARAFLAAMATLQASIDLPLLVAAIRTGSLDAIRKALNSITIPASLMNAVTVVNQVFQRAYVASIAALPGAPITLDFAIVNPLASTAARKMGAWLVTQVSAETKAGIRALIARSFADGLPPVKTARLIRDMIGITERQAQAVLNARAAWSAAGLSADAIERKAKAYAAKLLRQRGMLIARTESIQAANLGQLSAWQQAAKDGLIQPGRTRRIWHAAAGDRTCPLCKALNQTTVPFAEPWPFGKMAPPRHPACRCSNGLVFISAKRPA